MGLSSKKTTTKSSETLAPSTYSQPYIDQSVATVNAGAKQSAGLAQPLFTAGRAKPILLW